MRWVLDCGFHRWGPVSFGTEVRGVGAFRGVVRWFIDWWLYSCISAVGMVSWSVLRHFT